MFPFYVLRSGKSPQFIGSSTKDLSGIIHTHEKSDARTKTLSMEVCPIRNCVTCLTQQKLLFRRMRDVFSFVSLDDLIQVCLQ
jgi:hypothetical protein